MHACVHVCVSLCVCMFVCAYGSNIVSLCMYACMHYVCVRYLSMYVLLVCERERAHVYVKFFHSYACLRYLCVCVCTYFGVYIWSYTPREFVQM